MPKMKLQEDISYAAFVLLSASEKFTSGKRWWRGEWTKDESKAKTELDISEERFEIDGYAIQRAMILEEVGEVSVTEGQTKRL